METTLAFPVFLMPATKCSVSSGRQSLLFWSPFLLLFAILPDGIRNRPLNPVRMKGLLLANSSQVHDIQARALIVNGPSPFKHSPHPPVPRMPNNTVPTLQKCPLIQEKSLSPLETARITQFCAVCASKCPTQKWVVWRSGSTSRSDQISLQNPHGESAICKISACGEPEERECEASPSAASHTAVGRRVPRRKNRCGHG